MEGDWHFKFQASIQYIIMLVLLHFHFYRCNSVNNAAFGDILLDTFYFSCPCDGFLGRPEGRIFPFVTHGLVPEFHLNKAHYSVQL